jgi:hypothetical protein
MVSKQENSPPHCPQCVCVGTGAVVVVVVVVVGGWLMVEVVVEVGVDEVVLGSPPDAALALIKSAAFSAIA